MSKPKLEPDEKNYYKNIHFFYEIINDLKKIGDIKNFLKDILTSSELRMVKKRWHIASLLTEGNDIRSIAHRTQASTQTVSKIKKTLEEGHGGLKLALEQMQTKAQNEKKQFIKNKIQKQSSKYVKDWF